MRDERVLVLLPTGRDGALAQGLLQNAGLAAPLCANVDELVQCLSAGAGLALIADEALARGNHAALRDWVEAQPAWSDIPFVVLTSGGDTYPRYLRSVQLTEMLRNVTLLERPLQSVTLVSAVRAGLRARRRQYEVREALANLDRAAAQLRRLNDTLEERVADRTHRLEQANQRLLEEREERRRMEDVLRQAHKMQAVGHLTGGIAHDFNNLLTVISGNLEMLSLKAAATPALQRFLTTAVGATERAARLTQQLLAFSRKQHLQPQPVGLDRLADGIEDLFRRTIGADVELKLTVEADLWPALVDPNQVETALLNLVINARDAGARRIEIRLRNARIDEAYAERHVDAIPGDYVEFCVSDNGSGMAPDVLARAFEPFFTTKEVGRGSGLGLSMVYGFVKQSKGQVRLESRQGEGTTVLIYLPRAAAETAVAPIRQPGAEPPLLPRTGEGKRVLIVEDDDDVRDIAVSVLADNGYEVVEAETAHRALDILAREDGVDVVFTDIVMPGTVNGIELAKTITERWPSLPVIVTTGYAERLSDPENLPGHVVFLSKPYRPFDLVTKVRSTLSGAAAHA
jgi:signal transduction histidine kinase